MKLVFMLSLGLKATALAQSMLVPDELRALLQQADLHYPLLQQQQAQLQASQVQVAIVQSTKRPAVLLNGAYAYVTPVPGITLPLNGHEQVLKFAPDYSLNTNASVGQTLSDFGRTHALSRLAADNVQIARSHYEGTRQALTYQVAAAYYSVGFLQQAMLVQDSVIKTAGATARILGNRLQNGTALQYDVYSQQVRVKVAINRKIELQNQLERQVAALTFLTGDVQPIIRHAFPNLLAWIQSTREPRPDSIPSAQLAVADNKDLLLAQARLKAAQTDFLVSQRAGGPVLTISGAAGWKNGYPPATERLRANLIAGINLNVPLYAGNRYALQTQLAQINQQASQSAVDEVQAQLRQRLANLLSDIQSNHARLVNLDAQVQQAQEALAIAGARWRNGVITTAELQNAQTGLEESALSRLQIQYQLLLNQLELERLLGSPLL